MKQISHDSKPCKRKAQGSALVLQKSKTKKIFNRLGKEKELYLLLLPAILLAYLFRYVPMYGALMAFKDYNPILTMSGSPWVGLKHFEKLFSSMFFERAFWNTIIISFLQIIFSFPMPIIFALFLNEIRGSKFKRSVQTVSYLPHFLSWVIVGGFLVDILSPTSGAIGNLIRAIGFEYTAVPLAESIYFRPILVLSSIWKTIGWGSIVYLAAITAVDTSLYEAAEIDGAGRFKKMWFITLPELAPTIATMFILKIGQIMNSDFEQILVLYSPSVYDVGDVLATFVYREGILKGMTSYATAAGLFQSLIGFALVIITNKICKKLGNSLW